MMNGADFRPQWYRRQLDRPQRRYATLWASGVVVVGLAVALFQLHDATTLEPMSVAGDAPRTEAASAVEDTVAQAAPAVVAPPQAAPAEQPRALLEVSGTIMPRSGAAWAYVNGRSVEVGETVANWRLIEVRPDAVVFENDAGRRRTERLGGRTRGEH